MICLKRSDALALISKECSVTYAGLCDMISRYSALISSTPCTKVAIFSENRPEWVYIMYAGWKSGYTVVPIDYMS
ncbi:MAG: long-chain fatty acid--CoA ligase, partial [Synergistaceae bacterium]|nr:long-chain fatty acid--CoA ligase [Synergistaceae bacterium]